MRSFDSFNILELTFANINTVIKDNNAHFKKKLNAFQTL